MLAPIESALVGVSRVRGTRSLCRRGGAEVRVRFGGEWGTDEALALVAGVLPEEGEVHIRLSFCVDDMALAVAAPAEFAPEALDDLVRALERSPGVALVQVYGRRESLFRIQIDQERLVAYGLSPLEVLQSLRVSVTAGPAKVGDLESMAIGIRDEAGEAAEPIRLRDVAQIRRQEAPPRQRAWLDGRECSALVVYAAPGAELQGMRERIAEGDPDLRVFSPKADSKPCLMATWYRPAGMHPDLVAALSRPTRFRVAPGRLLTLVGPGELGLGARGALLLAASDPGRDADNQLVDFLVDLPGLLEAHVALADRPTSPPGVRLFCDDIEGLLGAAEAVRAALTSIDGILSVAVGLPDPAGEVRFVPDPARMASLGLSTADIETFLRLRAGGVGVQNPGGPSMLVRIGGTEPAAGEILDQLIPTSAGVLVRLSELGEVESARGVVVPHIDGKRGVLLHILLPVTGRWAQVRERAEAAVSSVLPEGVRVEWPPVRAP